VANSVVHFDWDDIHLSVKVHETKLYTDRHMTHVVAQREYDRLSGPLRAMNLMTYTEVALHGQAVVPQTPQQPVHALATPHQTLGDGGTQRASKRKRYVAPRAPVKRQKVTGAASGTVAEHQAAARMATTGPSTLREDIAEMHRMEDARADHQDAAQTYTQVPHAAHNLEVQPANPVHAAYGANLGAGQQQQLGQFQPVMVRPMTLQEEGNQLATYMGDTGRSVGQEMGNVHLHNADFFQRRNAAGQLHFQQLAASQTTTHQPTDQPATDQPQFVQYYPHTSQYGDPEE
jgi:hypothetical protein